MYKKYRSTSKPVRKTTFDNVKEEDDDENQFQSSESDIYSNSYHRASVFTSPYIRDKNKRRFRLDDSTNEKMRKS